MARGMFYNLVNELKIMYRTTFCYVDRSYFEFRKMRKENMATRERENELGLVNKISG